MAKIITQLDIPLPGNLDKITEQNFAKYLSWQNKGKEVSKRLVEPFKGALCAATGYDDDNRPAYPVTDLIPAGGGIVYGVTTEPTTKRPAYSKVNESLKEYVDVLVDQYERGIRRKDILTVNEEPYVAVEDLMVTIQEDLENILDGKEGVKQSVHLVNPDEAVEEVPESISITLGRDYSALTEFHATMYETAKRFVAQGNAQANAYKKKIKKDSVDTLGDTPDDVVALAYAFENLTFVHQLEPRFTPKHKDILYAFIKEKPKRFTKRSKFGDFVKAQMLVDKGEAKVLEDKGLVDSAFRETYQPIRRKEKVFVRLYGLRDKLEEYYKRITTDSLEQNVFMQPGVDT
jgi:hypothetical protein